MPNIDFKVLAKYGVSFKIPNELSPKRYRTRIAPSPTGYAHIGTFRTALFNYLAAKASGGHFYLRIDDTDTERNNYAAIRPIKEALAWLGLYPDSEFHQSARLINYKSAACRMVNAGLACVLDNGAIALKWHDGMPLTWRDNIAGDMAVSQTNIDQIDGRLILITGKDKGYRPTYQLASTYDDWDKNINYIIRGTDHISNTAKQLAIWWALNKSQDVYNTKRDYPEFAHLGLIFKDGKKLSKRDGAASVLEWRDKGYTAEALNAFMLRLGWAPKEDNKANDLLPMERAIHMFLTEGRMRNSAANMDTKKLDSYERKIRAQSTPELIKHRDTRAAAIKVEYDAIEEAKKNKPLSVDALSMHKKLPYYMRNYLEVLNETLAEKTGFPAFNEEDDDDGFPDIPEPFPVIGEIGRAAAAPVGILNANIQRAVDYLILNPQLNNALQHRVDDAGQPGYAVIQELL